VTLVALGVLSACGAIGGISRDTSETLIVPDAIFEIVADKGLNPDSHGVAKPVQLRLYELRSKSSFERAGFLDLQDKDDAALGSDFVRRDELLILPGEKRALVMKGNPEVKMFGVLVAYRELDKGTWRAMTSAPNSLELRKSWWGFGSIEKPKPIEYVLKLDPTRVQLELKSQGR
jgi:type VI secretion system protein VasD